MVQTLTDKGIYFVAGVKSNAKVCVLERREVMRNSGLTSDQTITFTGTSTSVKCPCKHRRVGCRDEVTGRYSVFLTNNFKLSALTIARIYKPRWAIELFFQWLKKNLRIKSFQGTSQNAVLTQIWIAMCVDLLIALLKFQSKLRLSMQKILRWLQMNWFEQWALIELLRPRHRYKHRADSHQFSFF